MNYIKHLTGFFDKVVNDKTLNPTHISLYIALFQFWNCNRFKNPISISRDEVMRISKICSKATYHKCLKNLHTLEYIKYEPSYNPYRGSLVYLFNFSDNLKPQSRRKKSRPKNSPAVEQVADKSFTSIETSNEQALVPYINSINNTNTLNVSNLDVQSQNFKNQNSEILKMDEIKSKQEKLRQKNKIAVTSSVSPRAESRGEKPTLDEVKKYFQEQNHPELEGQKFYNYFSSNGWLVGGKTQMVNWNAAAENWMLNSINFKHNTDTKPTNRAKHLNTTIDKNYSEPL